MGTINEPALYDLAGEKAAKRAEAERDYIDACAEADMLDAKEVADLFGDWNDELQAALTKMVMAAKRNDNDDTLGYAYDAADALTKIAKQRVRERIGRAA